MIEQREVPLHEIEITGQPGNIVAVYKIGGEMFAGLPTRVISWGPLSAEGRFKVLVPDNIGPDVLIGEYDPCMAAHFEKYGHINTEPA